MKRWSAIVLAMALGLSGCGNTEVKLPVTNPVNEDVVKTAPSSRIILDEQPGVTLFAVRSEGMSDYRLHVLENGSEKLLGALADGQSKMVMGAALSDEPGVAYVVLRDSTSSDSIIKYDYRTDTALGVISDLGRQNVTGFFYNTLNFTQGELRFIAEAKLDSSAELPEPTALQVNAQCLNDAGAGCAAVTSIPDEDKEAFQQLMTQKLGAGMSSMSGQSLSAAAAAIQMHWPKGNNGHHFPGSSYHSGKDAYSLDINRGGMEDDWNDPVRAAAAGKVIEVIESKTIGGYGNRVRIQHANGAVTLYAHLNKINVARGSTVQAKQSIGTVGNTGLDLTQKDVASHLHFTVYASDGRGVAIANSYYPIYAKIGSATAACSSITTDMRTWNEYYPC